MAIPRKPEDAVRDDMSRRIGPVTGPESTEDRTLVPVLVRIGRDRKVALLEHFQGKGLDMSSGIRQVLYEYMAREHIKM